ncbi:MAG TPA: DUF4837 family protein [Bacteroidales bacterium]|nr:DUF4837 family protein [Bacteroidales bacterium]
MKNRIVYFYAALIVLTTLFMVGCNSSNTPTLPTVSGKAGEVIVVMDKTRWEGEIGDLLRNDLAKEMIALPQPEPMFDLINITPAAFGKIFKSHRNIIIVKIDPQFKESKILVQKDVYAKPQYIFNLIAPNDQAFKELLKSQGDKLLEMLKNSERKRLMDLYRRIRDNSIYSTLEKHHHLTLSVPRGYSLDVDTSNFVWISNETPLTSQGILIYTYPYRDTSDFNVKNLIRERNRFLKKYVPGPTKGSYMATESQFHTVSKAFMYNGRYFKELRGLWRTENAFMGGPFISLSTVDQKRNRIVTVEGFVYAPRNEKRPLLRQVEAIIYSLQFPDEDKNGKSSK